MTLFQIFYTREAKERLSQIAQSDPKSARIIFDHIKKLEETRSKDPFLTGDCFKGLKRNRTGRYRFIYRVLEHEKEIPIITVDLRRSIYD